MKRLFNYLKFFRIYKSNVSKHEKYLNDKYNLDLNIWYELSTTLTLIDAPEDLIKEYGPIALAQAEVNKYIKAVLDESSDLDLNELIKTYEVKKLSPYNYGITFGFSLVKNRKFILIKNSIIVSIMTAISIIASYIFM